MDNFPRNPSKAEVKRYTTLRKYLDKLIKMLVSENIKASGYPVKEGAIGTLEDSILTIVDEKVLGGFGLLRYVMNNDPAKDADNPLDGNQLKEIMRIVHEAVTEYIATDKKFQLDKKNRLAKIGIKQNMAHYWWGQHHQVLFCKTSDGLLLHVPQEHLLRAMRKEKSVVLKKWPAIQAGKKRKKKLMEKGKQKDLEPSKESDILVLPEPKRRKPNPQEKSAGLPELPLEIQLKIIMFSSKPSQSVRKLILKIVKPNAGITMFSVELAKPKLVWGWYATVLGREPPKKLAMLWNYHVVQNQDPNAFVRTWYAGFVRAYDIHEIRRIYDIPILTKHWFAEKMLASTTLHFITAHLRGDTIGGGSDDLVGATDFQKLEYDMASAMEILKTHKQWASELDISLNPAANIKSLFRKTMNKTILDYGIKQWENPDAKSYIHSFLMTLEMASWESIRVFREIPEEQPFSAKDYAALVWLNNVLMNLIYGLKLRKAARVGYQDSASFLINFQENFEKNLFFATSPTGTTNSDFIKEHNKLLSKEILIENKWVAAGGIRGLTAAEQAATRLLVPTKKENLSIFSANIDLVPGNDKIPYRLLESVTNYISNVMGYEDEEQEEDPPISEIMKALVQDGLKKNYSKDTIKEKILYIIKRFMMTDNWEDLDSNDFAKVEKDASAKIDLALSTFAGKEKEEEEEEEEEAEAEDDYEREYQREQAARDRKYARLRRKDKEKKGMSSSKTITAKFPCEIAEKSTIIAKVVVDGSFVAAKILGNPGDKLFGLALNYVKKHNLKWHITKPRSWTFDKNDPMGPHITLSSAMRKYKGEKLVVETLNITSFTDPPSRWVVLNVKLPKKFQCVLECHISMGQERQQQQQHTYWN